MVWCFIYFLTFDLGFCVIFYLLISIQIIGFKVNRTPILFFWTELRWCEILSFFRKKLFTGGVQGLGSGECNEHRYKNKRFCKPEIVWIKKSPCRWWLITTGGGVKVLGFEEIRTILLRRWGGEEYFSWLLALVLDVVLYSLRCFVCVCVYIERLDKYITNTLYYNNIRTSVYTVKRRLSLYIIETVNAHMFSPSWPGCQGFILGNTWKLVKYNYIYILIFILKTKNYYFFLIGAHTTIYLVSNRFYVA